MSKNRPGTKGYLIERSERGKVVFYVGAKDETDPANKYDGPCAEVAWDETWLTICTDQYEGHAMLNIEALEPLRKALAKISRQVKAAAPPQS